MTYTSSGIDFDTRQEIGAVLHALEDWDSSPSARKADQDDRDVIRRMISRLDAMEMAW